MLRAAPLLAFALSLGSSAWAQSPTAQIGAVPPPPWCPVPAPQAPAAPVPAQAPTILLVQVPTVAPAMQAAPVMTVASAQSPGAAYGYVNPFVTTTGQAQQGIGQVMLTGATFIVDNPWILDRILGRIGEALHKRGYPTLKVAPITTTTPSTATAPIATQAVVSSPAAPLVIYQQTPRRTALGRWFWGE